MSYKYTPIYKLCLEGDIKKIEEIMKFGLNYYELLYGLEGACEGGHKEIIQMMIEKGATKLNWYINYPENKKMILELIGLGVTREQLENIENIEELYEEIEDEIDDVLEEEIIEDIRNIIIKMIV